MDDILADKHDVVSLFTNRPRPKEIASFNQALAGLYAAGHGARASAAFSVSAVPVVRRESLAAPPVSAAAAPAVPAAPAPAPASGTLPELRALLQKTLESLPAAAVRVEGPYDRNDVPQGSIVISGTGLGLPGAGKPVMDPKNAARILAGEQFIGPVPQHQREGMARRRITQLVKTADGSGHFQTIDDPKDVIKLAGLPGSFDLAAEYGVSDKLVEALDSTSQLAMAAGLDALREAGIPLVQTWKRTTTGKFLPERWMLPEAMRDETGVVFASAFPGYNRFADEARRYYEFESRRAQKKQLEELLETARESGTRSEISRRIAELDALLEKEPYAFDRRFLLRVLTMGHSQFAEYVGARGPNTHVNAACASTASAIALAEDWIRSGRCRRVVVVAGDNVTSDAVIEWFGAGFIASGAGATDERVEDAALPFDRRRHGTLIGMGACALVVESQDAVEERGMRGIAEVLSTEARNSAFHATRLDVDHVASVVESLVACAERRFGIDRRAIAPRTVFVSHETYTPARGGSAAAEITALRQVFGDAANRIIIANTKGFTGHPMGVGIEDVIGVKILEHQVVPPVPNLKEPDPDLGSLTLSRGGRYDVEYAIHLAAGFGSQIALTFTRKIPGPVDRVDDRALYERWLAETTGHDGAKAHTVRKVLRVSARSAPAHLPAASTWRYGLGPVRRVGIPRELVPAAPEGSPVARPVIPRDAVVPGPEESAGRSLVARPVEAPREHDAVVAKVLSIVAEKTGYPSDMLEMDLDLEADLGVDTVKQAETFAAVREAYGIARQDSLKLRDFPTLKHVVQFVYDFRPDLAPSGARAPEGPVRAGGSFGAGPTGAPQDGKADPVVARVLAIVAEKTGYPSDMLEMDLDLEADLGVDTVKQAETFAAVREAYDIPRQENLKLRDFPTLKHVVQFVYDYRPDLAPSGASAPEGPVRAGGSSGAGQTGAPQDDRADAVVARVLSIVAEKTGYPPDMLEMDLDLEADLGVDTVKQAETFAAVRDAYGIAAPGEPEAPRLPDAEARRAVRVRLPTRLETRRRRSERRPFDGLWEVRRHRPRAAEADGAAAGCPGRCRRGQGPRHSRREDRLPARHAGNGPRPRGRPRGRHRQASGDVRRGAGGVRDRAAGEPEAPGLPDAQARRAVRVRLQAGLGTLGCASTRGISPCRRILRGRADGCPSG